MNRRILTLAVAMVPIMAFGVLLTAVTVPFVSWGPGPTFNTLGEVGGKDVVDIVGTQVHPTSGNLNMTTVSQRDDLTLGQALILWLSGREQLVPHDIAYPPGSSREDVDKENDADFKDSEHNAQYAALSYLKYPFAVVIDAVNDHGPSSSKLQPGDAIDAVNGNRVATLAQFQDQLKGTKPGQQIVLDYRRKNAPPGSTTITLGVKPQSGSPADPAANPAPDRGYLGVAVMDAPWAPFDVKFNLDNVGGPSAGLMFSLAVIDKLTTGDLNGSKFVAGTGTISGDGKVGEISGIAHKMLAAREAGATVFLVPANNCDEAKSAGEDGLELVKVDTLGHAVDALKTVSAGGEPPRC